MKRCRKREYPFGGGSTSKPESQTVRPIGYKFLKTMEEDWNPKDIVVFFVGKKSKLEQRLRGRLDSEMISVLLKVFAKMLESDGTTESLAGILHLILECDFQEKIATFLHGLSIKEKKMELSQIALHVNNALKIMNSLLSIMPTTSETKVSMTMVIIQSVIDKGPIEESRPLFEQAKAVLGRIKERRAGNGSSEQEESNDLHSQAPPDDFRQIPVFPQLGDILGNTRPFIRTNLIDKAYQNLHHYLDVQFRLLREDFVRPLRDGIAEITSCINGSAKRKKTSLSNRVYENVALDTIKPHPRGILHKLHFNTKNFKRIRWKNTKRLICGNMVCLSSDNFQEDILFAVVIERKPEDLEKGLLSVQFLRESEEEYDIAENDVQPQQEEQGPRFDAKKEYVMVETEGYFEAYRYVLAALKEITDLPLERYIVHCSGDMLAPLYLRETPDDEQICYNFSSLAEGAKSINVLNGNWPTAMEMGLDETQTDAVKLALKSELAIIQGPPGTGKTYVGLAIVKLILKNRLKWYKTEQQMVRGHCPILLVCFTNHALDQFLEGVAKFTDHGRIVRVGGRCKNNATQKFSLYEIRKHRREKRIYTQNNLTARAAWTIKKDMKNMRDRFEASHDKLEKSMERVLTLTELKEFIPPRLFQQFAIHGQICVKDRDNLPKRFQMQSADEMFQEWLGLHRRTRKLSDLSTAVLLSNGHKPEEIRRAYAATRGTDDTKILHDWIEKSAPTAESDDTTDEESSEDETDDDIMEEADFLQERRLLEADGWEERKYSPAARDKMKYRLKQCSVMADGQEQTVTDLISLGEGDRWRLYRTWLYRWRDKLRKTPAVRVETYNRVARELNELRNEEDAEILQQADVVALTTSGAAKYRSLIYRLNCKIVVVEEAAEVLEAHIITSMPRTTEHLILIGDHQQLKPSPTVYDLAKHYNLDTSLFERLISKVPHVTLTQQHRMRSAIADLIRPHIYNNLLDHESVLTREEITGIQKPVFFISHTVPEESISDGKSKRNQYEAEFLCSLCKYILMQGYQPGQITILTMYTAQLFAFRDLLRKQNITGVKATVVDNFQGEENDIILLSLVRSNEDESIGFLKTENRICVALSRAKNALYCIGNTDCMCTCWQPVLVTFACGHGSQLLASKSSTWRRIVTHLRQKESIGESLVLQCKKHPEKLTPVKCAEDFSNVLEGGCLQQCGSRLDCGHVCERLCHPDDHTTSTSQCTKPCNRFLSCGEHKCKGPCWKNCPPCDENVVKIFPDCGHEKRTMCCRDISEMKCYVKVPVTLPCGHQAEVACSASSDPKTFKCKENCNSDLKCGHKCSGSCHACFQGRLHRPCMKKCGRTLVCGHACNSNCALCPPCEKRCRTKCKHSKCSKKCGESCVLCKEKCSWKCKHHQCGKLCGEPCDRPPCNEPCSKLITKCQHPCIGLCGEPCPTLCKICDKKEVNEIFFGDEEEADARFVELEDCGHIFTYQSLDQWMKQEEEGNSIKMKECPRCKTTIWRSTRYGNIVNDLLKSLNEVKAKIWGDIAQTQTDRENLQQEISVELRKSVYLKGELEEILTKTQRKPPPFKLVLLEEKFRRLQKFRKIYKAQKKLWSVPFVKAAYICALRDDVKHVLNWTLLPRFHPADEETESFQRETERIYQAINFVVMEAKYITLDNERKERLDPLVAELQKLLFECLEPYEGEKEQNVKRLFLEISEASNISSTLAITHEEREMICKAMGFARKGHWYKCPKGHVYSIGECGGASEKSVCPECKEAIGGRSHQLLPTNQVATEMDGATQSAYDDDVAINRLPVRLLDGLRRDGFG